MTTESRRRLLGVVAVEDGWVPPLRYLLRRARALSMLEDVQAARLLEVGCGSGALLCDLAVRGLDVVGLETSTRAAHLARRLASRCGSTHEVKEEPDVSWLQGFDAVCSFDVLEHIEDDAGALQDWREWLNRGGVLLLSVPAHPKRWGAGDVWAGHWRRYDRSTLVKRVEGAGFRVDRIECYGFPLANVTEWVGNFIYRRMLKRTGNVPRDVATANSGVDREQYVRLAGFLNSFVGVTLLRIALVLQYLTRKTDWGSGYLVLARKV